MQAHVIWLTGLSGAGKTSLSKELVTKLRARNAAVEAIDGDGLRAHFPATGFTREARGDHVKRVGYMAGRLEAHGIWVVASLISPYRESRMEARKLCNRFVEVHVSTPLSVCEARDAKGLYHRARAGELKNFTGVNDVYEEPENPEYRVDLSAQTAVQVAEFLLGKIWIL
jgi:adenylylsulfate kinase